MTTDQRGDVKEGEMRFTPTHTPQSSSDSQPRTPPLKELIDDLVQCNTQAVQTPECIDEDYSSLRGTPLLSGRVKQKITAMVEEFVDAFLMQLGMCVLQATGRQEARLAGINTKVHRTKMTFVTFDAQRRLDEERREREMYNCSILREESPTVAKSSDLGPSRTAQKH